MTVWATIRRVGAGTAVPLLLIFASPLPLAGQEPAKPTARPTVAQLRIAAEAAEKSGDWDTAFTAYCHLFVADRGSPEVREKLNLALRRAQQLRRHRDPQFQHYVGTTTLSDATKLFSEVLTKVPVLYVDRERATPQLLWEHGLEELARALANPVFRQAFLDGAAAGAVEKFRTALRMSWPKQTITSATDARIQLRKLIGEAQGAFTVRVPAALVHEVVCGACSGLDEYTMFLNPAHLNPDSLSAVPDLTAQGVYLGYADSGVVITGVASGSWAHYHTALRKGDRIARLNGRSMEMATAATVSEALRNPVEGFHDIETTVGGPDSPAVVARLPVVVPSVYGIGAASSKDGVGYIRIGSFTASTARELDDAINNLRNTRGVRVLVLDVRGNMGGSFLAGVEATKRLLPAGLIVTTQGQLTQVDNQPFSSDSGMTAHDLPVVLLVDAETASAAEVFAAALKDHNRASLVGMPTFGKGAIQYPFRLDSLDSKDVNGKPKTSRTGGVRLTIARLISPRGAAINGVGITPDILEADPRRQLEIAFEKAIDLLPTTRPMLVMPTLPMIP